MSLEYLYRCDHGASVNNGLKDVCMFEHVFPEGSYHCPLCGHLLAQVSDGPTVSEVLRRGQQQANRKTPNRRHQKIK
jgi:hypothetical protein